MWSVRRVCRQVCVSHRYLSVSEAVTRLGRDLAAARVSEPEDSAVHLVGDLIGCSSPDQVRRDFGHVALDEAQLRRLDTYTNCRLAHMPVQYIIGHWDFRSLHLLQRPPVFIPRPETETLVDLVRPGLKPSSRVLEIGCGSGALGLALLAEVPGLRLQALDQSRAACSLTRENALRLGLADRIEVLNVQIESWEEDGEYDVIVSNPPYVLRKDLMALPSDITLYEDLRALDGGSRGVDVILPILAFASRSLKAETGRVWLEVDPCHPLVLPEELEKRPEIQLQLESVHKDLFDKDRFMVFSKSQ
eukprot:maker-scaffold1099_size62903-snap-gene-0.17 protein:Tk01127 transcript:maker-scaffold1099_size62903-snap-gene-0.17-mRNA-1 annotation:"methyltransferase family member 1"